MPPKRMKLSELKTPTETIDMTPLDDDPFITLALEVGDAFEDLDPDVAIAVLAVVTAATFLRLPKHNRMDELEDWIDTLARAVEQRSM